MKEKTIMDKEKLQAEHREMVKALAKDGNEILKQQHYLSCHLIHMVLGISGEAGELLDTIKKYAIYGKDLDKENVIEELGDLEFYMEGLRSQLGITREQTLEANIRKLSIRYEGFKYSDQQAQERKDKL